MKTKILLLACLLCMSLSLMAGGNKTIRISTDEVELIYQVANNGRLYQSYFGRKLHHEADLAHLSRGHEAYPTHGMEDYFEPAFHIEHNDGNPSTLLKYVEHNAQTSGDVQETVIILRDDKYPVTVKQHYVAYQKENVIKTFTEISHKEKKPVALHKYASAMLHLNRSKYFLTEFSGDWASETHITSQLHL